MWNKNCEKPFLAERWKKDKREKNLFIFCIFSFLLIFFVSSLYPSEYDKQIKEYKNKIKKNKNELFAVQSRITSKEKEIDKIKGKEKSVKSQLEIVLRNLEITKNELSKLHTNISKQTKLIKDTKEKLEIAKTDMSKWREIMRNELRFAYKQGIISTVTGEYSVKMMLSANSSTDLAKKYKFLRLLARQKTFIYLQAEKNANEYEALRIKLEENINTLKRLEAEKKSSESRYVKQKKEREDLLSDYAKKRIFYEREIADLRDSEKMLADLITLFEKKAQETERKKEQEWQEKRRISQKRGSLLWPLDGAVAALKRSVIAQFGKHKHPQLDTWVINNGIRIKSTLGQKVLAVEKGEVVFSGEFKSYGNVVIIDHGGGFYTVYGNLDEIYVSEGKHVIIGETIGTVGVSVHSQDASLYFELRKEGMPVDPLDWLK